MYIFIVNIVGMKRNDLIYTSESRSYTFQVKAGVGVGVGGLGVDTALT